MDGRALKRILWLLLACVSAALAVPHASRADGGLCLPVLTPLEATGFVELTTLAVDVQIGCDDDGCTLTSSQRLWLTNTDQVAPARLYIGAPQDCPAHIDSVTMDGVEIQPEGDALRLAIPAGANVELTAALSLTATDAPLLVATVATGQSARWGKPGDVRLSLKLAEHEPGALISVEPAPQRRSHGELIWDWQGPAGDVSLQMLNPTIDAALLRPETDTAHASLSSLAAWLPTRPQGDAGVNLTARLLAALHQKVDARPDDVTAHLLLADTYLSLADQQPEQRLNHMLLAIEQLDEASAAAKTGRDLVTRLADAYYQAALAAHDEGDPAGAIRYLNHAAEIAPSQQIADAQTEFVMRWGLDLARQGAVAEAIALLGEAGQLPAAQNLTRFAPPFEHAQTTVTLYPNERRVSYDLLLYGPALTAADEALEAHLAAAQSVPDVQATLELDAASNRRRLNVVASYASPAELLTTAERLVQAWQVQGGLLSELLAMPWRGAGPTLSRSVAAWGQQLSYAEVVDSSAFHEAWQVDADYANWWMIELHAQAPEGGAAAVAHELALLALRDQVSLWETLPTNTRWVYTLAFDEIAAPPHWLLGSGEVRPLSYQQTWYDWAGIGRMAVGLMMAAAALLILFVLVSGALRRRRKQRANRELMR